MANDDAFIEYVKELLADAGKPSARKMFGGAGVYLDGQIVGLVADGRFYLKIDDETKARFAAAGSAPFVYDGNGKPVEMSYWTAPDEALESSEAMTPWARLAQAAARRKAAAPKAKKRGTPKPKSLKAPFEGK
jgi:DNA transformation protein